MITAIFSIGTETLDIGFCGDAEPQRSLALPNLSHKSDLFELFSLAIRYLLCSAQSLIIIIVEPPLFMLKAKQQIAEVLLNDLQVHAVGFLQRSVCCICGYKQSAGIMLDKKEQLAVPVYDFRELSPMIVGTEEFTPEEVVQRVVQKVSIDVRAALKKNVVEFDGTNVFQGASALALNRNVWPLFNKERLKRSRVWDSLYDVR